MESNYEKEMNKRNEKIPYEKEMNKRNEKIPYEKEMKKRNEKIPELLLLEADGIMKNPMKAQSGE